MVEKAVAHGGGGGNSSAARYFLLVHGFNGSTIEDIMKEAARWYDIEVVFHYKINETFVAKISRELPLSRLLNLLEMTGQVSFTVEGNKVTVWSKR